MKDNQEPVEFRYREDYDLVQAICRLEGLLRLADEDIVELSAEGHADWRELAPKMRLVTSAADIASELLRQCVQAAEGSSLANHPSFVGARQWRREHWGDNLRS